MTDISTVLKEDFPHHVVVWPRHPQSSGRIMAWMDEYDTWLKNNVGEFCIDWEYTSRAYYFKEAADAVAFKLRFKL